MNDTDEDFTAQIDYAVSPSAVYQALTTPDGLRGWWGTHATVETAPGKLIRFDWSDSDYIELCIERLVEDREVQWTCAAQHDENLPDPDEWLGTEISFLLSPTAGGTNLQFTHRGLRSDLACYDMCAGGWDWFLRHSLRGLLELGQGNPFTPAASNSTDPCRSPDNGMVTFVDKNVTVDAVDAYVAVIPVRGLRST